MVATHHIGLGAAFSQRQIYFKGGKATALGTITYMGFSLGPGFFDVMCGSFYKFVTSYSFSCSKY